MKCKHYFLLIISIMLVLLNTSHSLFGQQQVIVMVINRGYVGQKTLQDANELSMGQNTPDNQ